LVDALTWMIDKGRIKQDPLERLIASVSVGIYKGVPVLDLDYQEDSNADTDMNVVMSQHGGIVEMQGTAEKAPFNRDEANAMMALAEEGIAELIKLQQRTLGW
jgi:ribonuclease PH